VDLSRVYAHRFSEKERVRKARLWQALWDGELSRLINPGDTVLDVGAGYCEFINSAVARRRIAVDLNPDTARYAAPGIEVHITSGIELAFLGEGEVDVVFTSNFLEHLPSKEAVSQMAQAALRVLRPGGMFIAIGPNVRLAPGAYWDFFDHHVPLSDRSLAELLNIIGFQLRSTDARFLPFTTKFGLVAAPWLVRAYLALRPLSSALLGRQFLIVAVKPGHDPIVKDATPGK
jgi:SAM-dependent methyltransferase